MRPWIDDGAVPLRAVMIVMNLAVFGVPVYEQESTVGLQQLPSNKDSHQTSGFGPDEAPLFRS